MSDAFVQVLLTLLNSVIASADDEILVPAGIDGYKAVPLEYID